MKSDKLIVYGIPGCPYTRTAVLALVASNVSFQYRGRPLPAGFAPGQTFPCGVGRRGGRKVVLRSSQEVAAWGKKL